MTDFEKMILERLARIENDINHIRYGDGQGYVTEMLRLAQQQENGYSQYVQSQIGDPCPVVAPNSQ